MSFIQTASLQAINRNLRDVLILTHLTPLINNLIWASTSKKNAPSVNAASEDSDQPAHSRSLIRIFIGRIFDSQGCSSSSCGQRRLWSDCTDAQADLSLRLADSTKMYVFARYGFISFDYTDVKHAMYSKIVFDWRIQGNHNTFESLRINYLKRTKNVCSQLSILMSHIASSQRTLNSLFFSLIYLEMLLLYLAL